MSLRYCPRRNQIVVAALVDNEELLVVGRHSKEREQGLDRFLGRKEKKIVAAVLHKTGMRTRGAKLM